MTRGRRVAIALGLLAVLLAGAVAYARPLLLTGTGYAAHNACAVHLVSGRPFAAAADDLPSNPLVPVMRTTLDGGGDSVSTTVLGLFRQTAWFTPGLGCTLAGDRPQFNATDKPLAGQGVWPTGEQVSVPTGSVDVAALDAAVDQAFAEDDSGGRSVGTRAVVVVHDGRIVAERYADGFDASTPQLGWSMAKSVTNAMVGRLVAEGMLALDDADLLDAWSHDERATITVDDLLTMTSGLAWDETYSLGSVITEMLYLRPDMGAFAAAQPLAHDVGTVQEYSSGTTNIICDVLAERSGLATPLAEELVFGPLGMASAVLEPDSAGDPVCSSYLWATPRDWARFGLWFAQGGQWDGQQLLPADWLTYSTTPVTAEGEDEGHAAHWWVNQRADGDLLLPNAPADTFWASGHDGQRVFVIPSAGTVVVRQGFTPEIPGDELGYDDLLAGVLSAVGE